MEEIRVEEWNKLLAVMNKIANSVLVLSVELQEVNKNLIKLRRKTRKAVKKPLDIPDGK